MNREKHTALALCATGALLWGTIGIFVKKIDSITPLGIAGGRLLIAFVGMLVLLLLSRRHLQELRASKESLRFYILLALMMSVHFILSIKGFHATTVANAAILNNTVPIFVPLFSQLLIGEKTTKREWIGTLIAVVGVGFVFAAHEISFSSEYFLGNLYATLAAVLLAIYIVLSRKIRQRHSAITVMTWIFGLGSLFIFLEGCILSDVFYLEFHKEDLFYLIGLGIFGTLVAHTAFNASLKRLRSSVASLIGMLSPITATCLAFIILGETPPFFTILGIGITLTGIALVVCDNNE